MHWLDNVLFNGEEVIFTRLKYLYTSVERFYICEKKYTHQGKLKDILYIDSMRNRFIPYMDKIVFIIDDTEITENVWINENNHRNFSVKKILDDYPTDKFILTVCDTDEIPNKDVIANDINNIYTILENGCIYLKQALYYYNLKWYLSEWTRAFIVNDILIKTTPSFQLFRNMEGLIAGVLENGGWHLSYFMSKSDIIRKIESFAHSECNTNESKQRDHITECLMYGRDLYKRENIHLIRKNIDGTFPTEILEFNKSIIKSQYE
jgi:beta-1,4-mannosyl-glycoprotein beta-1,4-N-acetylglucosaminyltransferase